MRLVDVHAHLEHSRFEGDLDEVVGRFVEGGGVLIVESGVNPESNRKALELAGKYDVVKCSFGMYPIGDYDDVDGELAWIEEHAGDCVAIGEIGLDFYNGRDDAGKQEELFRKMLGLAKKLGKPVVVHSRAAEKEVIEILEELDVVMHCFCGRKSLIKRGIDNGWFFSVPPVIMRWDNFKVLVSLVPIKQLLTETDAPYLAPVASDRNEPVNVLVTLKEIARIKGVSVEEVSSRVFGNFSLLFGV